MDSVLIKSVLIRECSIDDLPQVVALIGQEDMSPDSCLTVEKARQLYYQITESRFHKLYVAEVEGEIVGTFALVAVQQLSHSGARSVVIEDVVVATKLQGKGLGKQMVDFAVTTAKAMGCSKMILSSGTARTKAHSFYEHLGFKRDGIRFALEFSSSGTAL